MKYEYVKLIQITILLIYSLLFKSPLTYITVLILSALPAYRSLICSIAATASMIISAMFQDHYAVPLILAIIIGSLQLVPFDYQKWRTSRYIFPVLIFMLSLASMPKQEYFRNVHLGIFCGVLVLSYCRVHFWVLMTIRIVTFFEASYLYLVDYCHAKIWYAQKTIDFVGENPWWHYLAYVGIVVTCDFLMYGIKNDDSEYDLSQKLFEMNQIPMIYLHEISEGRVSKAEDQSYNNEKNRLIKPRVGKPKETIIKKYIPPHINSQQQNSINKNSNQSNQQSNQDIIKPFPILQQKEYTSRYNEKIKLQRKQSKLSQQQLESSGGFSPLLRKGSSYSLYSKVSQINSKTQKQKHRVSLQNGQVNRQSQIVNLFLVIPFTCFPQKYLQIPLYIYFISLHYSRAYRPIFFTALLSIFAITFMNYDQQNLSVNFVVRLCLVFMVDKNFELVINIAQAVRMIWLRSSFAIVLAILFWFGLLAVNIFHMVFIVVILLFITKGSKSENQKSFRNRNWKYLLALFNFFVILRFLYSLVLYLNPELANIYLIKEGTALLGISHCYTQRHKQQFFNLIPLVISAFIAIQHWTYSSKIYQAARRKINRTTSLIAQGQPYFKTPVENILNLLTMLFYKLVPWLSYAAVILILLWTDFSLTSGLLLSYIVILYVLQVLKIHSWGLLYKGWLIFSRLVALQIILRYFFQFAKFQLIYSAMEKVPWFGFLLTYQEILGLIIRQSRHVYLKAITKFQLMITLDFGMIFIAFLVYQYLAIIIKYQEIKSQQQTTITLYENNLQHEVIYQQNTNLNNQKYNNQNDRVPSIQQPFLTKIQSDHHSRSKESSHHNAVQSQKDIIIENFQISESDQNKRVKEIYENYINFKVTVWLAEHHLAQLVNESSLWYLKIYLPAIGVYACFQFSIIMGLYLVLVLKFYLNKNTFYYQAYIGSTLAKRIMDVAKAWQNKPVRHEAQELSKQLENAKIKVQEKELQVHQSFQKWLLGLAVIGVLVTYFSSILFTPQILDFLPVNTILEIDWILYISGTSQRIQYAMAAFLSIFAIVGVQSKSYRRAKKIQPAVNMTRSSQAPPQDETVCKYIDMQISILFGITKLVQRAFVIVLIFTSVLQDRNPFAIIYLLCAWILNSMGSSSILLLSRVLCALIIGQYFLMITDFSNDLIYRNAPQSFDKFRESSIFSQYLSDEWKQYLSFGDSREEMGILVTSLLLLVLYQFYFYVATRNWMRILQYLCDELTLKSSLKKLYRYFSKTYTYGLVYSPLCITSLCLALYFMDYTTTNLFLSVLSIFFLFKSFLVQNYADTRSFWRSYFLMLQVLVLIFMLIYCILGIPMYRKYCHPILCSPQEFRTKLTKAILLFILQVGVDLMKSHHFITAITQLKGSMEENAAFSRLAIAYKLNDRKIIKRFRTLSKKQNLMKDIQEVECFIEKLKQDSSLDFGNQKQIADNKESWLDTILELLPSLVDPALLMTPEQAKELVRRENQFWIEEEQMTMYELPAINQSYNKEFYGVQTFTQLKKKIEKIMNSHKNSTSQKNFSQPKFVQIGKKGLPESSGNHSRKSLIHDELPMESSQLVRTIMENRITQCLKESFMQDPRQLQEEIERQMSDQDRDQIIEASYRQQKKNLLYLLIFESILSNWQYITYFLMILEHLMNMGLLTVIFPLVTFLLAIPQSYQAPKGIWRIAFIALLLPILAKFILGIGLIDETLIPKHIVFLLLGDNLNSITIEYLLVVSIIVQCLILKVVGLYDCTAPQVECMKIAFIRNIINNNNSKESDKLMLLLKEQCQQFSEGTLQYIFAKWECKSGYDYSTMLVSVQLFILFYVFLFYDRMTARKDLSFYSMIEYNQFTGGMVVMALIQLAFLLAERFLAITNLKALSNKWDITLVLKYLIMLCAILLTHFSTLVFFPVHSGLYGANFYISTFYLLCVLYFLIAALQVKYGIDQLSRGFMERYTWYNGFVYTFFRAIPFLFEFKVFSDWTLTKTSLRLFDWIKFQEIFGRLYVAKCNSLFMRGKELGSKIQWWKKLLMGYPLLLTIILLLFGPLILFSALNPLASANGISGGYLELTLKINKTNQYTFYTNSHITDIYYYNQKAAIDQNNNREKFNEETSQILSNYDLEPQEIQIMNLQDYSDQYWQISKGSYQKLLNQPRESLYELSMRIRFDRNMTGPTPVYTISTYTIPQQKVDEFKMTLQGDHIMRIDDFLVTFLRLDNNNGLHVLSQTRQSVSFSAKLGKNSEKKYWVIQGGISFKIASDKYSKAIFGYSVMSFYISIILVIANYFRFLFQGSAHTIIMSDIPNADPLLRLCQGVYLARAENDIMREQKLFFTLVDLVRSPDSIKSLTGDYLKARLETIEGKYKED